MPEFIDEVELTIFDTETTGLEPQAGDRIVEIAALRIKGKERIATFQSLVNPGRAISEAAFAVNKITPQMLADAPAIETVLPKFLQFIQGSHLCSYNAGFDLGFLNNELKIINGGALGQEIVLDILKMAKRLLPGLERYALWFVADKLGIRDQQQHRALSDVELTYQVFTKLSEIARSKGIVDLSSFCGLFGLNSHFLESLHSQKIARIQEAINSGVKLKIRYLSRSSAQVTEREVMPKEIKQEEAQFYLVGHCCLRNEERSFRVDGILHLEIV